MRVIADGEEIEIGTAEATPTISLFDFSRRVTDEFGVTTIVPRAFSRRMAARLAIPSDQVDSVRQTFEQLRATKAQWVLDEDCAWLNFEGYYKSFELDLAVGELSYCTLEVEGLAEAGAAADPVGDPTPDSASSLRLISPVDITPANLTGANVLENDHPEWSAGASYALAARVMKAATHRIYESALAGNVGHDPELATGHWLEVGPTNRWAMFDQALGTSTSRTSNIAVTMDVDGVNALALLDVTASNVRVQTTGYNRLVPVGAGPLTFLDLPLSNAPITVTITGTGVVSVGTLVAGRLMTLGKTGASPTAGITDFSRKEVDDFGEVTIVERAFAKRMGARSLIRTDAIDLVANRLAAVRARPCLWIGDNEFDSLTIFGFAKEWSIERGANVSTLALSVEGLAKAAPPSQSSGAFNPRGIYDPDGIYAPSDIVTWPIAAGGTGDTHIRIGTGNTSGIAPDESSKWAVFVEGGQDGESGAPGYSNALIQIFKRSSASPAVPSAPVTYTFADRALSGLTNGWTATLPAADGNPLYVAAATASSAGSSDSIAANEWSEPVVLAQDGGAGSNGLNSASVFIFIRSATTPAMPGQTTTYTFATGGLASLTNGWSRTVPADNGLPLWVSSATAAATTATDTIPDSEWATPRIMAQSGLDGDDGAPGLNAYVHHAYADSADGTVNFTVGAPGGRAFQGFYTDNTAADSSNPASYEWGPYSGPATFGLVAAGNVIVGPDFIQKTSGGNASWNASAYSSEAFVGGCAASFVASHEPVMLGINVDPATNNSYDSIDYAIYLAASGLLQRCEQGVGAVAIGSWAVGDTLQVHYDGKVVRYLKNGTLLHTTTAGVPQNARFFLDTSIYNVGARIEKIRWSAAGQAGANGNDGPAGYSNAAVTIYRRAATTPALPSATATFTFATGALTGLNNGWSRAIPASDGNPLYAAAGVASSTGASDTIAANEWSSPVLFVPNGTSGSDGLDGLNVASVFLFRRAASAPAVPSSTATFTFASGSLTGQNNGWTQSVPANDGNPVWVITAAAASAGPTDTIASAEWAAPQILAANGAPGTDGNDGLNGDDGIFREFVWKRAASQPATPSGNGIPSGWSDDPPAGSSPLWMSVAKQELNGVLIAGETSTLR